MGVAVRVLAIVVGGYAAAAALVAAGTAGLKLAGAKPSDAFTVCSILGFLVYLGLALWAAVDRRIMRVVAALVLLTVGGGAFAMVVILLGRP